MIKKAVLLIFFITLLTAGCTQKSVDTDSEKIAQRNKPVIYTTIYPIYDFTKKIGGSRVEVIQIIPPGVEPHHFELSAKTLAELSKAAVLIYNGAGMEPWIDKIKQALDGSQVMMVDTSSKVNLIAFKENHEEQHEEEEHEGKIHRVDGSEGEHRHDIDPHIWLSPLNAKIQGQAILEALQKADPANADYFLANYEQFARELDELHAEFTTVLNKTKKREIVVAHEALGYLAREYGLVQIPIRGLTAEAEPSPAKIKEIIELAKNHNITYIFFETMVDPKVSQIIAAEIGAGTLQINTLDNITQGQLADGEDYFSLMRQNLDNLKKALSD
ncbi:metal ABC transporter substrate-binding protein [Zhaonella formicivorans]|uniref:metal ABC transporter substrate-binding protein n=1 Tax=Zhaonella formicivorans TaxID=2528593 RepID=UPI001D0F858F|nr:metal ABC transporter substrate-binding protein [Zhaonella formicivorans]